MDWTFIIDILSFLGFDSKCVRMVNTLFSLASTFVVVNNNLSPHILLHRLIRNRFRSSPYIYVMTTDSFGYVLENSYVHGQIQGSILLNS